MPCPFAVFLLRGFGRNVVFVVSLSSLFSPALEGCQPPLCAAFAVAPEGALTKAAVFWRALTFVTLADFIPFHDDSLNGCIFDVKVAQDLIVGLAHLANCLGPMCRVRCGAARGAAHGADQGQMGEVLADAGIGNRGGGQMIFGDSGLDRAASLRSQPQALAELEKTGRVLPLWRGKPMFAEGGGLVWVPFGHALLEAAGTLVFLGLEADGQASFAADLSAWEPESGAGAEQSFFDQSRQPHPALGAASAFEDLRNAMMRLTPREAELAASARAVLHWHRSHGFCAACGAASQVVQGGWQRLCPACGAHHFPRTDPVVIMRITHGNRVLLGRNAVWPEGMYSLLAGFVEPGETIEGAVRREVFEEAGVRVGAVRYIASQPWPFPANLMLGCQGEAVSEAITVDAAELEDALWLDRQGLLQVFAGQDPKIRPPRKGAIAEFLLRNWLADRVD